MTSISILKTKTGQIIPKVSSRRKKPEKIAVVNQWKKNHWIFEKINKIDKLLARLFVKEERWYKLPTVRVKRGDISLNSTKGKENIIENFIPIHLRTWIKPMKRHTLPKLPKLTLEKVNLEKINNPNHISNLLYQHYCIFFIIAKSNLGVWRVLMLSFTNLPNHSHPFFTLLSISFQQIPIVI